MTDQTPDLTGKCVSITSTADDTSHDLHDPHFEMQGGRLFIVGTIPAGSTSSDWVANCQGAVAWDTVSDYIVFDSLDAWKKAVKISAAHEEKEMNPTTESTPTK